MARKKRPSHRPPGVCDQLLDVPDCPYVYRKPFLQDGKWRARRRNRLTGSLGAITLSSARSFADALEDLSKVAKGQAEEVRLGRLPVEARPVEPITLEAAWEQWLENVRKIQAIRASTERQYLSERRWCLRVFGSSTLVSQVNLDQIDAAFKVLKDHSGRTRLKHAGTLRRLFRFLLKRRHVEKNPMDDFDIPRTWAREARNAAVTTGQALSVVEARALACHSVLTTGPTSA